MATAYTVMGAGGGEGGVVLEGVGAVGTDHVGGVAVGVVHHGKIHLGVAAVLRAAANHAQLAGDGGFAFEGGGLLRGGDGFGHAFFLVCPVASVQCLV